MVHSGASTLTVKSTLANWSFRRYFLLISWKPCKISFDTLTDLFKQSSFGAHCRARGECRSYCGNNPKCCVDWNRLGTEPQHHRIAGYYFMVGSFKKRSAGYNSMGIFKTRHNYHDYTVSCRHRLSLDNVFQLNSFAMDLVANHFVS